MNRRDVMTGAGAGLFGAVVPGGVAPAKPIGLQLFTLRRELARDVPGTLRQVARIGYREVEVFDLHGRTARELGQILRDNGLSPRSAHYETKSLTENLSKHIADAQALGLAYMVNSMGPYTSTSMADYEKLAGVLTGIAKEVAGAGMRFCYHNHNFELRSHGDTTPLDFLLQSLDPAYVSFELDCFWTTHAGRDPVAYFQKYPGRFPLLHIKDLKAGHPASTTLDGRMGLFAEVGQGVIDWRRIFAAAPRAGMKHFYVEQDQCERPAPESIAMSYAFLRRLDSGRSGRAL